MPRDYFAQFTWKKSTHTQKKNKGGEFWETIYTSLD